MKTSIIQADGYQVEVGNLAESGLQKLIDKSFKSVSKFILVDENTMEHCLPHVLISTPGLKNAEVIEIESGEINKNIDTVVGVWHALSELGADRNSLLINLGGGVIGDMGGFIASTFKRGIEFINIPTTLLSQVDASVGGKLGIDLGALKNQIGVINNPAGVFADSVFFETLPFEQMRSGYAEIVKHALIKDDLHWQVIKEVEVSEQSSFAEFVERSIQIKNEVVSIDPREKGLRKILNFGHTIGHAIESNALFDEEIRLLHGEAIAIGMICEAYLSLKRELIEKDHFDVLKNYLKSNFPQQPILKEDYPKLLDLMKNDKKNEGGNINFSLLDGKGSCGFNIPCEKEEIIESFDYYNQEINA